MRVKICDLSSDYALYNDNGAAIVTSSSGSVPVMFAHEINHYNSLRPMRPVWHAIVREWLQTNGHDPAAAQAEMAWRRERYLTR